MYMKKISHASFIKQRLPRSKKSLRKEKRNKYVHSTLETPEGEAGTFLAALWWGERKKIYFDKMNLG